MTEATLMTEAPSPSAADASQAAPTAAAAPASAPAAAADPAQQTAAESTDAQATDAGAADGEQKPADGDKPAGAPEKYEFTAPEGVTLDPVLMGEFEGVARELELPQDKAQLVVEKLAPKVAERMVAQQAEAVKAARADWVSQVKADPEIGGTKLTESTAIVGKFMSTFATPELRTLLDESGLGDHPEFFRLAVKVGKAISEDRVVIGGVRPNKGSGAQSIYANSNMNP